MPPRTEGCCWSGKKPRSLPPLDKIRDICQEKGIDLLLIKAPSLYPYWYDEWNKQCEDYARENGLNYINFLGITDEVGLDYNTDTYDGGLHMNLSGAEKLADYLGAYLQREYGLKDRRSDAHLSEIWKEKAAAYDAEIERQKKLYGIE